MERKFWAYFCNWFATALLYLDQFQFQSETWLLTIHTLQQDVWIINYLIYVCRFQGAAEAYFMKFFNFISVFSLIKLPVHAKKSHKCSCVLKVLSDIKYEIYNFSAPTTWSTLHLNLEYFSHVYNAIASTIWISLVEVGYSIEKKILKLMSRCGFWNE